MFCRVQVLCFVIGLMFVIGIALGAQKLDSPSSTSGPDSTGFSIDIGASNSASNALDAVTQREIASSQGCNGNKAKGIECKLFKTQIAHIALYVAASEHCLFNR